ncbi:Uncharacterised protein [Chlamydia abortus]|nr:Uncharacterised protein [Chlamydia abortus]
MQSITLQGSDWCGAFPASQDCSGQPVGLTLPVAHPVLLRGLPLCDSPVAGQVPGESQRISGGLLLLDVFKYMAFMVPCSPATVPSLPDVS